MAQRISRAKQRIKARAPVRPAASRSAPNGCGVVLHVLYLIFNEGYTASSGPGVHRAELTVEAIRLTRPLHRLLPHDGEVTGLLALMLLTDARRAARARPDGTPVPLAEQDRARWDAARSPRAPRWSADALARAPLGPYQVQAAIAALHDEAPPRGDRLARRSSPFTSCWTVAPGPVVTLNRAVALAMVHGPRAGLEALSARSTATAGSRAPTASKPFARTCSNWPATPARPAGPPRAARRTASLPEQRYLRRRRPG